MGRLWQRWQLSARPGGDRPVFRAGADLAQTASRADAQGLHGGPRVVLLRLALGSSAPVLRTSQCHGRLVREEGQPAINDPPDREAGGAGRPGIDVLLAARRTRARSFRWQRLD